MPIALSSSGSTPSPKPMTNVFTRGRRRRERHDLRDRIAARRLAVGDEQDVVRSRRVLQRRVRGHLARAPPPSASRTSRCARPSDSCRSTTTCRPRDRSRCCRRRSACPSSSSGRSRGRASARSGCRRRTPRAARRSPPSRRSTSCRPWMSSFMLPERSSTMSMFGGTASAPKRTPLQPQIPPMQRSPEPHCSSALHALPVMLGAHVPDSQCAAAPHCSWVVQASPLVHVLVDGSHTMLPPHCVALVHAARPSGRTGGAIRHARPSRRRRPRVATLPPQPDEERGATERAQEREGGIGSWKRGMVAACKEGARRRAGPSTRRAPPRDDSWAIVLRRRQRPHARRRATLDAAPARCHRWPSCDF